MLNSISTVLWDPKEYRELTSPHCNNCKENAPILRVMSLLQRVTHTGWSGSKDSLSSFLLIHMIQRKFHEFIHIASYKHVTV